MQRAASTSITVKYVSWNTIKPRETYWDYSSSTGLLYIASTLITHKQFPEAKRRHRETEQGNLSDLNILLDDCNSSILNYSSFNVDQSLTFPEQRRRRREHQTKETYWATVGHWNTVAYQVFDYSSSFNVEHLKTLPETRTKPVEH